MSKSLSQNLYSWIGTLFRLEGQLPRLYIPGAKTMLRASCLFTFLVRVLQESMSLYLVSLDSHLSRLNSTCSCAIPVELKTAPKYFISFTGWTSSPNTDIGSATGCNIFWTTYLVSLTANIPALFRFKVPSQKRLLRCAFSDFSRWKYLWYFLQKKLVRSLSIALSGICPVKEYPSSVNSQREILACKVAQ
eukprot:snap_masked-scaffold_9-processed-gene-4.15-mRNA-1 protein AED:1.00 eAED:1.00 QI:0/0/0/0/1/1/3/0/190